MRIKEHVLCPVCNKGVLDFYVPPFANGMVKEFCNVCDGKETIREKKYAQSLTTIDRIRPIDRGTVQCVDCGKDLPVRRRGRKRLRCTRHATMFKATEQQRYRKALRESCQPMVAEIAEMAAALSAVGKITNGENFLASLQSRVA